MPNFHEVRFPTDISYDSKGGPGFQTNIVELDSGGEVRIARWSSPRRRYNAAYGVKTQQQLATLAAFYVARTGPAYGFRYKDFSDFTTNPTDHLAAPSATDVVIGTGDGTTTAFQLLSTYQALAVGDSIIKTRVIRKPVAGTVKVAVNGVVKTITVDYTVDTTTGVVTMVTAPTSGHVVTAGCEYDVPVRFGKEVDEALSMSIEHYGEGSAEDIPLVEIIEPTDSTEEYSYGGACEYVVWGSIQVNINLGRVHVVQAMVPTSPSARLVLPDPTSMAPGGPVLYIVLEGTNNLDIYDHAGNALVTGMSPGTALTGIISLLGDGSHIWYLY